MRSIRKFRPLRAIRNAIRTDDEGVPNQFDFSFYKEAKFFCIYRRGSSCVGYCIKFFKSVGKMKTDFQEFLTFARDTLIGVAVFSLAPALCALGFLVD